MSLRSYFFLMILVSGCLNSTIYSDYDRSNNFSLYKTYAWLPKNTKHNREFDDAIVDKNILNYVANELNSRGYHLNVDNPDILLDYDITVEKKVETISTPVYRTSHNFSGYNNSFRSPAFRNGGGYVPRYRNQKIVYKEGTLTVMVIDKKKNQMVWKGWSEGTFNGVATFEVELPKDIHALFKKYPIQLKK